jgi:zinc protease
MECLTDILKATYLEKMRREEGGTYGAGVSGNIDKSPGERFIFQVYFDTNPEKKERLIAIVYEEIEKIRKQGPSAELLNKVKENLLKRYKESSLDRNAEYWANKAWMSFVYGIDGELDYEKTVSSITPGTINKFAENIFAQGNIIEVVMDPAK